MSSKSSDPLGAGITGTPVPLVKGPYQNNGATQWYTQALWGSPGQKLKTAIDTGSNFIWMTSSLCAPNSCQHFGDDRFIFQKSSTFQWKSQTPHDVSFGPWGTMTVEDGQDRVNLDPIGSLPVNFYLAKDYTGDQFAQLDWDGGIGIPSGSQWMDPNATFLVAAMMDSGKMDPAYPYVSFNTNLNTGTGSVLFGGVDVNAIDLSSGLFLPFQPYTKLSGVEYIWTTPMASYQVGDYQAQGALFCLDSGSSQFKGDPTIMNQTLRRVGPRGPNVVLKLGQTFEGGTGSIVIPPNIYMKTIEAGPDKGETLPQFNAGLALPSLVLVGSVLMDPLYTVYTYNVTTVGGKYQLAPAGMFVFNKKTGPALIQPTGNTKVFSFGPRPIRRG